MLTGPPSGASHGLQRPEGGERAAALEPVITLVPGDPGDATRPRRADWTLGAAAVILAVALALAPLWSGYYDLGQWAPLALGALVLLVVVALGTRPRFTHYGLTASGGLGVLLALSAASMLWAESKENAWTAANQLALYAVIFAIGVLAVRERRSARTVALILGAPALLTSVLIVVKLLAGSGEGLFLTGRLNSPMGYINGTAGLLVMGIWPWVALAEAASKRLLRAAAMSASAMVAGTAVLTQSRAIVPAMLVAAILVLLAAPQRTRRAVHLIVIVAAVALGLHWTLEVYRSTGPSQALPIPDVVMRKAGLAILAGGVLAGAAKLVLSLFSAGLAPELRGRTLRRLGQALIAASVVLVAVGAVAGHTTIRTQYDAFVNDKLNQAAPNRFLDAGGFRYDLWRVAVDEFTSHPIGGVGAGNYDDEYYQLRRNPEYVVVPHSLELQMAAELGIGGLLALLVFCGAILAAGFARRRTLAARDPMVKIAALGIFAAWLTATSVDWLYNFPGLAGAAILAAALLVVPEPAGGPAEPSANGHIGAGGRRARSRRGQAALVLGIGALALVAASIGRQYAASRYAASGAAKVQTEPVAAIHKLQSAEQLDPYSLETLYSIASAYARLDDYGDARAALLAAEQREPDNYVPPALLGDLATRRGYYQVALADYERARRLDPRDPLIQSLVANARTLVRDARSAR